MFSKLRSPRAEDRKPASKPAAPMHKQRTPAAATTKSTSPPSINHSRKPSFSDHQWEERHWTKPFASGVTQVAATLRFPPEQTDMHDLRRVPEEENLYGKAQKHSPVASTKASASPSSKCSTKSSASSLKSSASSLKSSASSVKSSSSSVKSSASSVKSVASSKSSVTLSSKASASSLWSERPSSSASNATHATSWSVDSSAPTVMTDLEALSKCNSNRPDSCTLGDFDAFKLRSLKDSNPKRPNSTVSSTSGTSCAGTIQSRPRTGKSSKTGDITFEIVAEEDDAIYLQRTPNPQPTSRRRQWG